MRRVYLNDGKHYVFPFSNINKGENIIIWGMGNVGEQYVEQIMQTKFCNILFAVDKYYEKIKNKYVHIKCPEEIKKYQDVKIVIAQGVSSVAEIIKEQLLNWELKKKILFLSV